MTNKRITTLFCDIGGVLLTNGWDRHIRAKAAEQFSFDLKDFEERHQLSFYLYEIGKISLKEYLKHTVFFQPRSFSFEEFSRYMFAQSESYEEMIELVKRLKKECKLKVILLSNEGRELSENRIRKYHLSEFADFFVVSSFVNLRKPDREIYRMAIDLVQVPPEQIVYIDDRQLFVEVAGEFGIHSIRHLNYASTRTALEEIIS